MRGKIDASHEKIPRRNDDKHEQAEWRPLMKSVTRTNQPGVTGKTVREPSLLSLSSLDPRAMAGLPCFFRVLRFGGQFRQPHRAASVRSGQWSGPGLRRSNRWRDPGALKLMLETSTLGNRGSLRNGLDNFIGRLHGPHTIPYNQNLTNNDAVLGLSCGQDAFRFVSS